MDPRVVYFDLETTGLSVYDCEILQIGAVYENRRFYRYLWPTKGISVEATMIHGIYECECCSELTRWSTRGEMESIPDVVCPKHALEDFMTFLLEVAGPGNRRVVLVGHNAKAFDARVLVTQLIQFNVSDMDIIEGVVDSLGLAKSLNLKHLIPNCKLDTLMAFFLQERQEPEGHHCAVKDAIAVMKVVQAMANYMNMSLKKFVFSRGLGDWQDIYCSVAIKIRGY